VVAASGGGVAGAIDFVGSDKSAAFAYGALAKGGRLVVAGLIGGEMRLSVPTLPLRGVAIEGNYVGSLAEAKAMLALVREGKVQPIPVTTRPLSEAQTAMDDLRAGKTVGRTVLVP
jgi:D-arabinose 1-dehydrogenase-like Zn-dependent alcohol dehydrogenase